MKKRTHSENSPSSLRALELCPSFVNTNSGPSKAGERGTKLHGVMEEHGADADQVSDEQETMDDKEQLELIADYMRPVEREAVKNKAKIRREFVIDLRPLRIPKCEKGTADVAIFYPKRAAIFDYKFGWVEVDDAEVNLQVLIYGAGVLLSSPKLEEVEVTILQPARNEVSVAVIKRSDLSRIILRAQTVVARKTELAGKTFTPNLKTCVWCARKATCLALHQFALVLVGDAELKVDRRFRKMKPEDINEPAHAGYAHDLAKVMESWSKAVKRHVTQLALDGQDVDSYRLVEVDGKRIMLDAEGCFEILKKKYKLTLSEFLSVSNPSVTKTLKLIADKVPRGEKQKISKAASDVLVNEGVLTQTSPSAYLVKIEGA